MAAPPSEARTPEGGEAKPAGLGAPLLAALVIGALYFVRLDDVFYFLYGLESQGLNLAAAVADGHGFVDLSLPGHPAHVREPPLFYLALAGLIRAFGFKLLPMKVFIHLGYVATAGLSVALFQRRTSPAIALLATVVIMSSPEMFIFLTGPKSDLPFAAIFLLGLLLTESWLDKLFPHSEDAGVQSTPPAAVLGLGALAGLIALAGVLTRSLGLALLVGGLGALAIKGLGRAPLRKLVLYAAIFAAPTVAGYAAWSARGTMQPNPAGYTYVDWFMMDVAPDSPTMTAVDFHAPLLDPPPRSSAGAIVRRSLRHVWLYLADLGSLGYELGGGARAAAPIALMLLGLGAMVLIERRRQGGGLVPISLGAYFLVAIVWPMDDPRLLMPLMPFAAFYALEGARLALAALGRRLKAPFPAAATVLVAGLAVLILALNVWRDLAYQRAMDQAPTVTLRPGFEVRFLSAESWDYYRLLLWARDNTAKDAVLMSHSPPPCRLISERDCGSVPATTDLAKARDHALSGSVDYIILDEWGKVFSGGAGWFVEHVARPMVDRYPEDFETVYRVGSGDARVARPKMRR